MKQNRIFLFITFLWLMYMGLVRRYIFSNEIISFIPDIFIFYISYRTIKRTNNHTLIKQTFGKVLPYIFGLLMIFSLFGAALNTLNILTYLWGIRMMIRYPLLMWCIIVNFRNRNINRYKKYVYYAFFINILFCMLQIIGGERNDSVGGTFGDNGSLMLMALITFVLSTADFLIHKLKLWKYLVFVAGILLIAIWAEIKFMYFLFPIVSYGIYVLLSKFNIKHIVVLVLAFFFLIPSMQYVMSFYYDDQYVNKVFDIDFVNKETSHSYGFMQGGFNRQTAIPKATQILSENNRTLAGFGLGSGSMSSYFKTELASKYYYTTFWYFSTSYCLMDIGWIGFILYCLCYLSIFNRFLYYYNNYKNPVCKYWASVGLVTSASTFLLFWYNDVPYFNYLPMFFLWGVCLAAIRILPNVGYQNQTFVYVEDEAKNLDYSTSIQY